MAVDYTNVAQVANRTFQEPINDLIARSNPTLGALTKRAVASDRIYLKYKSASDHQAGGINDGADVTFAGTEGTTRGAATLDWKTYISKFKVNKRTMSQLASNPGAVGQLLKDEIMDASKDLADKISTDLFAGTGSATEITGLGQIMSATNTYAGVDRAAAGNEEWQAVVYDAAQGAAAAAEISTDALFAADDAFFARNFYGYRERPGMFTGVCTPAILTKYAQLFTNIDLSSLSTAHFVNQANATGNLGRSALSFLGVPFMRDRAAQPEVGDLPDSGRLYMVDFSKLFLATLAPSNEAMIHQVAGAQSAPVVDGLKFEIEFLGNTGEHVSGYVRTYIELVAPAPKCVGVAVTGIDAIL